MNGLKPTREGVLENCQQKKAPTKKTTLKIAYIQKSNKYWFFPFTKARKTYYYYNSDTLIEDFLKLVLKHNFLYVNNFPWELFSCGLFSCRLFLWAIFVWAFFCGHFYHNNSEIMKFEDRKGKF